MGSSTSSTFKPGCHLNRPIEPPSGHARFNLHLVIGSLVFIALVTVFVQCAAAAQDTTDLEKQYATNARSHDAVENLANIQTSIELKRKTVRELRVQAKQLEDSSELLELGQKIERINNEITSLQQDFEHIALGGLDLSAFSDQPEQVVDWRVELEQVSRPLLSTLKEMTARPRQIDNLRREYERQQDLLMLTDKAIESIQRFSQQSLPPVVSGPIDQMLIDWQQRRDDTRRALEITEFKLTSLQTEGTVWYKSAGEVFMEFVRGRGLTLVLAVLISIAIWQFSKFLIAAYWRWLFRAQGDAGITSAPLIYYSYRLATAISIVLAILLVFYVRGDVLLITLALLALVGAALTLRQTLPRYAAELRLLFGVGPVREGERLVLDGVPLSVESLGVYTVLRNPALEGVVRLPLHEMNSHASRPATYQEPWFPCLPDDYVLLANGSFGRVLRQTIELVEIMIQDARTQISTRDFITQNVRNLSRDGFGIACTFGIDYQHQAISLDTVPKLFREAIVARFDQAGMKDDILDMLVEFKAASANSLDYQIYLILSGGAAKAYFRAQRMVQQACVDTCNREGWVIPFTQVTVHAASIPDKPGPHTDVPESGAVVVATETG